MDKNEAHPRVHWHELLVQSTLSRKALKYTYNQKENVNTDHVYTWSSDDVNHLLFSTEFFFQSIKSILQVDTWKSSSLSGLPFLLLFSHIPFSFPLSLFPHPSFILDLRWDVIRSLEFCALLHVLS